MNKKLITLLLICSILTLGCTDNPVDKPIIEPMNESIINKSIPNESIPVSTTPELDNLIQFLEEDKTDEIIYTGGQRGINYFVCTGFSRALAKNASEYNITMGAISLRNTPCVGRMTKYYHAMNYIIIDNDFVIIEPQSDEVFYLDTVQYHQGGVYRYISIYQDAQMMSNYGRGRETIDIDLRDYNETEIINKWRTQYETK